MEPPDYARYVMENVKPFKKQIFKDLKIYFNGGDLRLATEDTRKKMTLLVKHGATLLPTYDATTVTHIVTTAEKSGLLKDIGIRSLKSIPRRIPVLAWKWVARSINDGKFAPYHDHPAYSDRITLPNDLEDLAPRPKGKGKEKAQDPLPSTTAIDEVSAISRPARVKSESSSRQGLDDAQTDDPLAPFYAQARAEHEATLADAEALAKDKEVQAGKNAQSKSKKAGFSCDRKGGPTAQGVCPNQDVVDKLAELMEIHRTRNTSDDKWRVLSYTKAISALRAYPHRIKNLTEAKKLPGVGEKTAQKIIEIIDTGRLNRLKYEKTEDVEVIRLFQGIYGVGAQIARQWYAAGCRTLDDLRKEKNGVKLTSVQQIGLKYYDDINTRIPREEAKEIYDKIREIALRLDPKLFIEIMGSYRRGKQTCGDIDILITRPTEDGKTHRGVLWNLMRELHAKGIMTEDLSIPDDWQNLEICYRGLCRRDENSKMRRIDFLSVPYESRGGALLYYTFNRSMRLKADKMGYSLNQRGLSAGVVRDPQDRRRKLHGGTIIASATEEEIFKMLDVPWQEPHERNRE
ncbi:Nucleotidyltransferase [Panus rudis PR-1116 ss-1]|nr:Nucleotidyltransferase [Panus rudis PR-1116 ss-1]